MDKIENTLAPLLMSVPLNKLASICLLSLFGHLKKFLLPLPGGQKFVCGGSMDLFWMKVLTGIVNKLVYVQSRLSLLRCQ